MRNLFRNKEMPHPLSQKIRKINFPECEIVQRKIKTGYNQSIEHYRGS